MLEIKVKAPAILVVKPSSLGDIFHAFPAVEMLRRHWPEATIDWLVRSEFTPVLEFYPHIRKTVEFPRRAFSNLLNFPGALNKILKDLRSEQYDLVIDFQGLIRSAFFTFCARTDHRIGFANPREAVAALFYNMKQQIPPQSIHAVEKNIQLVCGLTGQNFDVPQPDFISPPEFKNNVDELLSGFEGTAQNTLGIIPGARWESKRWPAEFFAKTVERVQRSNSDMYFIVIGGPDDVEAAEFICRHVPSKRIINLAGKTGYGELVESVKRCRFMLSNDSGPMHIAAAMGKKVFGVFGPTDPERTGPYGGEHKIFQLPLDCIACLKRECPLHTLDCQNIDPANVADEICSNFNDGDKK